MSDSIAIPFKPPVSCIQICDTCVYLPYFFLIKWVCLKLYISSYSPDDDLATREAAYLPRPSERSVYKWDLFGFPCVSCMSIAPGLKKNRMDDLEVFSGRALQTCSYPCVWKLKFNLRWLTTPGKKFLKNQQKIIDYVASLE